MGMFLGRCGHAGLRRVHHSPPGGARYIRAFQQPKPVSLLASAGWFGGWLPNGIFQARFAVVSARRQPRGPGHDYGLRWPWRLAASRPLELALNFAAGVR